MCNCEIWAGHCLSVWVGEHAVELCCKFVEGLQGGVIVIEDSVDPLGCPWASSASFHIGEDEEDLTPLILEFYGMHGHIETAFGLESVKVIVKSSTQPVSKADKAPTSSQGTA